MSLNKFFMQKGKVLALDYGTKHVGMATGDEEMGIAFPRDVLPNREDIFDKILSLCVELGVGKIIIGMPFSMSEDFQSNKIVSEIESFAKILKEKVVDLKVDVEFFDERLTSFEAEQMTGKKGRTSKERLDAFAAQVILQRYFDGRKG